jgi:D-xylose reductase
MAPNQTIKLNSGHEMPLVGFGLWKVDNDTCADTVYNAIKAGYRLLDGACGMFPLAPCYSPFII